MLQQPDMDEGPGEIAKPLAPRRSRRRPPDAASIGVAALVALAAAGLYFMHWRTRAGVDMVNNAVASSASLDLLLAGGQKQIDTLSASLRATQALVDRFDAARRDDAAGIRLARARPIERDPFAFAPLEPRTTAVAPRVDTGLTSREQARQAALSAARQLQLQSIIHGSAKRSCLIDGKLYFETQAVGEFTITRISPDSVILQSGEFSFELRLRR